MNLSENIVKFISLSRLIDLLYKWETSKHNQYAVTASRKHNVQTQMPPCTYKNHTDTCIRMQHIHMRIWKDRGFPLRWTRWCGHSRSSLDTIESHLTLQRFYFCKVPFSSWKPLIHALLFQGLQCLPLCFVFKKNWTEAWRSVGHLYIMVRWGRGQKGQVPRNSFQSSSNFQKQFAQRKTLITTFFYESQYAQRIDVETL